MIDAKDLRIGNLVQDGAEIRKINGEDINNVEDGNIHLNNGYEHFTHEWSAIPLDENWLKRMGAKDCHDEWNPYQYELQIGAIKLFLRQNAGIWYSELGGIYMGDRFKFVHDIQNIKHALTGHELEIKEI